MRYLLATLILLSSFGSYAQESPEPGNDGSMNYGGQGHEPHFKGDMEKFLADNLHYPADAKTQGVQGVVTVYCMIDKKGKLTDPIIIKPLFPSIDSEAIRLVNMMPDWAPAKVRGKAIETNAKIQIPFRL